MSPSFWLFVLLAVGALDSSAHAGTPSSGTVYIGAANGVHNVYRVVYQYDGVGSISATASVLATLPTAADAAIVPGGDIVVAGQGSNVYRISPRDGSFTMVHANNNGNVVSLDSSGTSAWVGWFDTSPSQVPLNPFGDGTPHSVSGDDGAVTQLAFTPGDGVFYTSGGIDPGAFGRIDLTTFTTTRLIPAIATGMHYDAFSRSLILAGAGRAAQVDPASPSVVLSSRDDSPLGENYLSLRPDGLGHLFGTRFGGGGGDPAGGRLVLIDYSASKRIGDASTIIVSAPIVDGLSGGVAVDTAIFVDGFEPGR